MELSLPGRGGPLKPHSDRGPGAAIVAVGEELLLGRTVDSNSAWLSGRLARLGVPVRARWTVGDEESAIGRAISSAMEQADVVVVSGGLGPTHDDRTREAVSLLLDRPLVLDPTLLRRLEERFRARGIDPMPASNVRQARVPAGARILGNPVGTAPALAVESDGRILLLFPGVPVELKRIYDELAEPYLRDVLRDRLVPLYSREIHTTGVSESALATQLEPLLSTDLRDVELAFLPQLAGVTLRLSVRGASDPEAGIAALDRAEATVDGLVREHRFRAETGDLVEAVAAALLERRLTIATGESCTGGLVAKRLTDQPGASAWFLGGVVAYSNDAKAGVLGVPRGVIEAQGAVSREVAEALARGAQDRFGADCGLGITGVAGPDGGTVEKPVGTVWYAAAVGDRVLSRKERFSGDRPAIRVRSAQAVLALVLRMLGDGR